MRNAAFIAILLLGAVGAPLATTAQPAPAALRDHPKLKRYEGSELLAHHQVAFDEATLAVAPVYWKGDSATASQVLELEGAVSRLVYAAPKGRSTFEVSRNYRDEIAGGGGQILFECKDAECLDAKNKTSGKYNNTALRALILPDGILDVSRERAASCATAQPGTGAHDWEPFTQARYFVARLGDGTHVAVLVYQMSAPYDCQSTHGVVYALVTLVVPAGLEQRMVTVKADEIAKAIDETGRIAIYGIYFDTDKAVLKPESKPALDEIAKLLQKQPELKLHVVGHTDDQGGLDYNMGLSRRRAEAVVAALTSEYGIAASRLIANGVAYLAPVASNREEAGRAKNRRVELVPQ